MTAPRTAPRRWRALVIVSALVLVASYAFFVLTPLGQALENAALRGADQVLADDISRADEGLSRITVWSLGFAVAALGILGLLRRQPKLALAAGATVVAAVGISQVLKRFILVRPHLVEVTPNYLNNSFPSGHTTIALAVLLALVLVGTWRQRGLIMFLATSYALAVGAWTLTAKWHRLSDTLGASAIALGLASLASLWLYRQGLVVRVERRRGWLVKLFVIALVLAALVTLGLGLALVLLTGVPVSPDEIADYNIYLGLTSLASAGSILTALAFWWSWARLEVEGPRRRAD